MATKERPALPQWLVDRIRIITDALPQTQEQDAWIGLRWRIRNATIAHAFGGQDGFFRLEFRGQPDDVAAFVHLGHPYFKAGWGDDMIGLVIDEQTDWDEVAELLIESYCLAAPKGLAQQVIQQLGDR